MTDRQTVRETHRQEERQIDRQTNGGRQNKILIQTSDQIHEVFGSRFSPKTDFIHMRGHRGQEMYTSAIIEAIENTLV